MYYAIIALAGVGFAVSQQAYALLLPSGIAALYSRYLYRGGRFVLLDLVIVVPPARSTSKGMLRPYRFGLAGLALALAAGCSSSSGAGDYSDLQNPIASAFPSDNPAHAESTPQDDSASLSPAGTITESDHDGTAFSETYQIGQPTYGSTAVPQEVLDACNADYGVTIGETAFTPGQVTVSYAQGSIPADFTIVPNELISGTGYIGTVALSVDGGWQCGVGDPGSISVNLNAGDSETYPIWILSQVLSNSQPKLTANATASWRFDPTAVGDGTELDFIKVSGPNSDHCGGTPLLGVFTAPSC